MPGQQKGKPHKLGAGRPRSIDHPVRQTVYLDQRHMQQISEWQDALVPRLTFSAALRQILDLAIAHYGDDYGQ